MPVCKILTSEEEIAGLADEWRGLQIRIGLSPFTDYDYAMVWWRTIGKPSGAGLAVAACFENDRLIGIVPLVVRNKKGVRVLYLLGHEVFYYKRFLLTDESLVPLLWQTVLGQNIYDVANIKNIQSNSGEDLFFQKHACRFQVGRVYQGIPDVLSCEMSRDRFSPRFCKRIRRTEKELQGGKGSRFCVFQEGAVPERVVHYMTASKKDWAQRRGKKGVFDEENPCNFYLELIQLAAQRKSAYLSWLEIDGKNAGVLLGILEKNIFYAHTLSIDDELRKWVPGYYLVLQAVIWATQKKLNGFNLMEGEEAYKTKFTSDYTIVYEYIFARTLAGRLFVIALLWRGAFRRLADTLKAKG